MNILVTGGAGYIGSVLVPELLSLGNNVTVIDNFLYRQSSLIDCCKYKNFTIINGDSRDEKTLLRGMEGADVIIPLAALVGFPVCDRDKTAAVTTNRDAVKKIIELRSPEQKIIFP
ncbi:MAG: NAD(P)-dependent oxidoreductase, partial [Clostridia bacterium]|nr:NAD(P)-dependent oxidoreductase [Clostridia bacterium]